MMDVFRKGYSEMNGKLYKNRKVEGEKKMVKIVLNVEGMMCGMCESHINDAVRSAFPVKKVTSSHAKGETVILAEQEIDGDALRKVIDKTGYTVTSVTSEPYEKKGFFRR
jgi:copper chaperone CopZ